MPSSSHLAFVEGNDGIPLWKLPATVENIPSNDVVGWLEPYTCCVVLVDRDDGTSHVVFDGVVAYAVSGCLVEVWP